MKGIENFSNLKNIKCPIAENVLLKIENASFENIDSYIGIAGEFLMKYSYETKILDKFLSIGSVEMYSNIRIVGDKF